MMLVQDVENKICNYKHYFKESTLTVTYKSYNFRLSQSSIFNSNPICKNLSVEKYIIKS